MRNASTRNATDGTNEVCVWMSVCVCMTTGYRVVCWGWEVISGWLIFKERACPNVQCVLNVCNLRIRRVGLHVQKKTIYKKKRMVKIVLNTKL